MRGETSCRRPYVGFPLILPLDVSIPLGQGIIGQIPSERRGVVFNDLTGVQHADPLLSHANAALADRRAARH